MAALEWTAASRGDPAALPREFRITGWLPEPSCPCAGDDSTLLAQPSALPVTAAKEGSHARQLKLKSAQSSAKPVAANTPPKQPQPGTAQQSILPPVPGTESTHDPASSSKEFAPLAGGSKQEHSGTKDSLQALGRRQVGGHLTFQKV